MKSLPHLPHYGLPTRCLQQVTSGKQTCKCATRVVQKAVKLTNKLLFLAELCKKGKNVS